MVLMKMNANIAEKRVWGSWKWRKRQSFLFIFGSDGQMIKPSADCRPGKARNSERVGTFVLCLNNNNNNNILY